MLDESGVFTDLKDVLLQIGGVLVIIDECLVFIIKFHIVLIMKQEISDILDKQTLDDSPVIQTLIVGVNCEGKVGF